MRLVSLFLVPLFLLGCSLTGLSFEAKEQNNGCTSNIIGIKGKYPKKLNFVNVTAYPFCVKANLDPKNRKAVRQNTIAMQKAINETIDRQFAVKTLYFPKGVYYFDDTLDFTKNTYQQNTRYQSTLGDGPQESIIKLVDNAPGFNDPAKSKIFIKMAKFGGANNSAHNNYVRDLSVRVGANNAGVIALNYIASNHGAIENVHIRSDDPQKKGAIGLGMLENWPGPSFVKQLMVDGFDYGVKLVGGQYGVFFETVTLYDQRKVGFYDENFAVINNFKSYNKNPIPAFQSSNLWYLHSTITNAYIVHKGNSLAQVPAFNVRDSHIFVRNATVKGYKYSLSKDKTKLTGNIKEYASKTSKLFKDSPSQSMNMTPSSYTNCQECDNPNNWYIIEGKGFTRNWQPLDYTQDMKKAFASGKPVIYIGQIPGLPAKSNYPTHVLGFTEPLVVPSHVKKIAFWYQTSKKIGNFPSGKPMFIINGKKTDAPLILEGPVGEIEHIGARPLVVKASRSDYKALPKAGNVYFEDFGGSIILTKGQNAFGWALNPENEQFIHNKGGLLRVVGLKYEGSTTAIKTTNRGRTEVLGGFIYAKPPRATNRATFESYDSEHSLVYMVSSHGYPNAGYDWSVKEVRNGVTKTRNGIWDRNVLHTGYFK